MKVPQLISFCINTARNEIDHIKLLIGSLQENLSTLDHEIIVFVDSDNQGTFEWLLEQKALLPNLKILKNTLPIPYGYQRNINELFLQASNDIVSYLQSDMVICKDYDLEVLKRLEPGMILCSTRIEPPLHGNVGEKITYDFGLDPSKFDLKAFTDYAEKIKQEKMTEYFFAPFTLYKEVWNNIGGHDTVFRRSREDSDILTRLILNDVQIKQTWSALVYHFTCTSSRGPKWFDKRDTEAQERTQTQQIADNIELGRFITKWGEFRHDLSKPKYYNVAAHISGNDINLANFAVVQSFFHKVYVDDITLIELMQEWYDRNQSPANRLFNIQTEDWNRYGYIFNQMQAVDRILPASEIEDEDVFVKFDMKDLTSELFQGFIQKIQYIVDDIEEIGNYEYGPFLITINQKVDRACDKIIVNNPEIKPEHKYSIY